MGLTQVSYLGPDGTYAHKVARKRFGKKAEFRPCATIRGVFDSVICGSSDFGIVPIENTSGGWVHETVDVLVDRDYPHDRISIQEELSIEVRLAAIARGEVKKAVAVYSHPAALAHCRAWLAKTFPGASLHPVDSTTAAAKRAAEEDNAVAIASKEAASRYGLRVLHFPVADNVKNMTQFWGIAKRNGPPPMAKKTSIAFELRDEAGALHSFLEPFARQGTNLTRIISRPVRGERGRCAFLIEFQGTPSESSIAAALGEAKRRSASLRDLGSYPIRKTYKA